MRVLAEHEYKKFFEFIEPYCLVAPFGIHWDHIPPWKTLVITSKKYVDCFSHKNYEIRTYENCHAKLAVGSNGILFGSWNLNWPSKHREIVVFVKPGTTTYERLQDWFDETWKTAHPYSFKRKITKLHEVL